MRARRISIFVTILALFFALVLLTGAAITIGNFLQTRDAATDLAAGAFDSTIDRISERHAGFFAPVTLVVELYSHDLLLSGEARNPESLIEPVLHTLDQHPQLSSVYVGYENGDFFQIVSVFGREGVAESIGAPSETHYGVQSISQNVGEPRKRVWTFLDENTQYIGEQTTNAPDYDPRTRGWFQNAQARPDEVIRTAPYSFDANARLGVTLAKTLIQPDIGVIGADVTLNQFSSFLEDIRPNPSHRILAFDVNGSLIASPNFELLFKRSSDAADAAVVPSNITDIDDPIIKEAARLFNQDGPFELETLNAGGEEYLASVVRQTQGDVHGLYILYAAPRTDFEGSLAGLASRSLIPGFLVILLALPAIIYLARMISRPLRRLSAETDLIRSFKLKDPVAMESVVREIDLLIGSVSSMKATLREISKFVPQAIVRNILENEKQVAVGGEKRRLSLLFTDVENFTPISESMPPEDLMVHMSEYFEELVSLIIKQGGTVDKFVGDAIFAYWNAPISIENYEKAACVAALKCRQASEHLGDQWKNDGRQPWVTRFGVHAGDTIVGNVGSSDRIDYTVIGDTVNIASRLEGLNKYYGTNILVSDQIADVCADTFLFRHIDHSLPKGAVRPLQILELVGMFDGPEEFQIQPAQAKLVVDWNEVYEVYNSRDWIKALDAFEQFKLQYPEDRVAAIYLERITEFLVDPPADDWDGIMRFDKK